MKGNENWLFFPRNMVVISVLYSIFNIQYSILYFHNNTSKIHKSKYNKTFSTAKRQERYGGEGWKAKKT